jgi:hypothetical protein
MDKNLILEFFFIKKDWINYKHFIDIMDIIDIQEYYIIEYNNNITSMPFLGRFEIKKSDIREYQLNKIWN